MTIAVARSNIRRMQRAQGRCEAWIAEGRPDRGEERPCLYPAIYRVGEWETYVCGVHARAYVPSVLFRVGR